MKKIVFFLFAILGIATVSAQNGIRFEKESASLEKIFEKAKKENKIVFIDCYTTWCGPCKWMDKNVFTNDSVGDFFNSHFICAKIDMEKGGGPEIAKLYEVRCYPTFIFLNGDGKLLHRKSSSYSVQEFIKISQDALIPEKQYSFLKDKYDSGNISRQELISLMRLRQSSCLQVDSEVEKYFSIFSSDTEYSRLDWTVVKDFGVNLNSSVFKFLVSNKEVFYSVYTEDSVNQVILKLYSKSMRKCIYSKTTDTLGYLNLRSEVINLKIPDTILGRVVVKLDLGFYKRIENWKKYANTAVYYIDRYLPKDDYMMLNQIAWVFYEHIDNIIYLDMAVDWAKRSVELHKDIYNIDTFASLLFKRKKYEEALKIAEEAILLQKEAGQDTPVTQALLEKIKKAMMK